MPQTVPLHRRWVRLVTAILALFLIGGEPTEAGPTNIGVGEPSEGQAGDQPAQLRVVTEWLDRATPECGITDAMKLTIFDGTRSLYTQEYCSAYAHDHAQLITDERNRHYLLLERGEGHGTHATAYDLTVYEFDSTLRERARLRVREPVGLYADAVYTYTARAAEGGGITISGRWSIDGELRPGERAPARRVVETRIDAP
jgi:hypothetical protein